MKKYLNNLLCINFIIFVLIIFYTWLSPSIDYKAAQLFHSDDGRIFGTPIFASTLFVLTVVLALPISLFLIHKLLNIGRILFLFHMIGMLLALIDLGNEPNTDDFDLIANALNYLCDGAIIFLIYFSSLKNKFKYYLYKI